MGSSTVLAAMLLILCNPMFASTEMRRDEISNEFGTADIVGLVGTACKAGAHEEAWTQAAIKHKVLHFGWRRSPYVNKSCGLAFYLKPTLVEQINEAFEPPALLAGRLVGLRLEGSNIDITVLLAYFPPRMGSMRPRKRRMWSSIW